MTRPGGVAQPPGVGAEEVAPRALAEDRDAREVAPEGAQVGAQPARHVAVPHVLLVQKEVFLRKSSLHPTISFPAVVITEMSFSQFHVCPFSC